MEYLLFLQNVRANVSPVINDFMNSASDFAIGTGSTILLLIITYVFDKKLGRKMCASYGFNAFLSVWIKGVACISRPWIRDSRIIPAGGMTQTAGSFSFPSGHAGVSVSLFFPIIVYVKNNIIKILSIIGIFIISFSRNYIGVHTLEDVVCGALFSVIGCVIIFNTIDFMEKNELDENGHVKEKVDNRDIIICLILLVIYCACTMHIMLKSYPTTVTEVEIIDCKKEMIPIGFTMLGCFIGMMLERRFVKFNNDVSLITRIIRVIVGLAVTLFMTKCLFPIAYRHYGVIVGRIVKHGFSLFIIMFVVPLIFTTYEKLLKMK